MRWLIGIALIAASAGAAPVLQGSMGGFPGKPYAGFYWDIDRDGTADAFVFSDGTDLWLDVVDGNTIYTDPGDDVDLDNWMLYLDASEDEIGGSNFPYDSTSAGTTFSMERFDDEWTSNNRAGRFVSFDIADGPDAPLVATGFQGLSGSAGHAGAMTNIDHLEYDRAIIATEGIAYYAPSGSINVGNLDYGDSIAIGVRGEVELDLTQLDAGSPTDLNADTYIWPSAIGVANDFEDYVTHASNYQWKIGGAFSHSDVIAFLINSVAAGTYSLVAEGDLFWQSESGTKTMTLNDSGGSTGGWSWSGGSSLVNWEWNNGGLGSGDFSTIDFSSEFTLSETVANELDVGIASTIARDTELHDQVTLAGTPDYITLSSQIITRGLIDLTTDVTGVLPDANVADDVTLNGAEIVDMVDGNGTSIVYEAGTITGGNHVMRFGDVDALDSGTYLEVNAGTSVVTVPSGVFRVDTGTIYGHQNMEFETTGESTIYFNNAASNYLIYRPFGDQFEMSGEVEALGGDLRTNNDLEVENTSGTSYNWGNFVIGATSHVSKGRLELYATATEGHSVIYMHQQDSEEPFFFFDGSDIGDDTGNLILHSELASSSLVGYLRIEIVDDQGTITTDHYWVPFYSITVP